MPKKTKNNYWYTASYTSEDTGMTAEATGGLSASSDLEALTIAYDDLEALGDVRGVYIYELKDQGELGEMVMQVGGKSPPKEAGQKVTDKEQNKDDSYDDCVFLESVTIRKGRTPPKVLNKGDYHE